MGNSSSLPLWREVGRRPGGRAFPKGKPAASPQERPNIKTQRLSRRFATSFPLEMISPSVSFADSSQLSTFGSHGLSLKMPAAFPKVKAHRQREPTQKKQTFHHTKGTANISYRGSTLFDRKVLSRAG